MLSDGIATSNLSAEERLHIIADFPYDWEYWQLPDGSFEYISSSCERLTGYKPEAFMKNPGLYFKIIHPDDLESFKQHRSAIEGDELLPLEFRIIAADGAVKWIEHTCCKLFDDNHRFLGWRASNRDITARKNAEQSFNRTYIKKKVIIELARIGTWEYDVQSRNIVPDEQFKNIYGLSPLLKSIEFQKILLRIHPEDRQRVKRLFEESLRVPDSIYEDVHRIIWPDGSIRWISSKSKVFHENTVDGSLVKMLGTIVDVTDFKNAQEQAESGRRNLQAMMDILPVGVFIADASGRLININPTAAAIWGSPTRFSESIEQYENDYKGWWPNGERIQSDQWALARAVTQGRTTLAEEIEIEAADGTHRNILNYGLPIKDQHGTITGGIAINVDITNRKQVEEALRRAQAVAHVGNWLMNVRKNELTWSEETYRIFDIPEGTPLTYESFLDLVYPDDRDKINKAWQTAMLSKSDYNVQHRIIARDRIKWVHEVSQLEYDQEGTLIGAFGTAQDITELKETEQALQRSRADFLRAQKLAQVGNWKWQNNKWEWSEQTYRIFDIPVGTPVSHETFISHVHPEDREKIDAAWNMAVARRTMHDVEHRADVSGRVKWIRERAEMEFDDQGNVVYIFGTTQDITELKEAEQQLVQRTAEAEESQRLLDAIMEHVPVGITVVTLPDTTIRLMSRFGAERINGGKREHFEKTKDWVNWRLTRPDGEPVSMDQMPLYKAVYENQGVQSQEYLIDTEKDQRLHLLISAGPILDSEHKTIGGIAIWQDITELKAAEKRLQQRTAEAEEWAHLLDLIMEHIPVGIMLADAPDVRIRLISRFGAFLLNKGKRSDFEGFLLGDQKQIWNLLSPGMVPVGTDLLPLRQAILKGQTSENQEYVLVRKGENIHLFISAGPIRNKQDEIIGGILVWQDITELKRVEQSLQHSRQNLLHLKEQLENKNKELESVLAIVSHDLRSPLVSISGFSQEIRLSCRNAENIVRQMQWPGDQALPLLKTLTQEIPESIEFIQTSSNRMDTLVRSLVKVARAGIAEIRPERLNMNELVAEASASIGFEIKEAQTDLRIEDLPECFADRAQASQIFSNLLDNAIKYLDPNRPGRIRVSGSVEQTQSVYCVEDNGIGISPEYQDKIFELFLRIDRNRTAGEGIGLAMVKRLVARNNGSIWVESVSGEGSKFYVSLPRSEPI